MKSKLLVALLGATITLGMTACSDSKPDQASSQTTASPSASASASTKPEPTVDRDYQGDIPAVSGQFGVEAVISAGQGPEPTSIVAKTLKAGDGKEIKRDDFVTIHYAGALWDGTVFDSSYSTSSETTSQPVLFDLQNLIQGWQYGLENQHVGDRVELIIPSQWGYGDKDQGKIPAGSTLVFVIDIVDAISGTDTSVLQQAKPMDVKLPEGISVSGEPGQTPTVKFDGKAKLPEQSQTWVLTEGTGAQVTADDYVVFHFTSVLDTGQTRSTWEMGRAISSERPVGQGSPLVGQHVGSRILIYQPAADGNPTAQVVLIEILGATSVQ